MRARTLIGAWVEHYNAERLQAGLGYLPAAEFYPRNPAARRAKRQVKLETGRRNRQAANEARLKQAA